MSVTHAQLPNNAPLPIDSTMGMQDLVRLQLKLQTRIAAVRNASETNLSYQAVQEQNVLIKEIFIELEEKLQVCQNCDGGKWPDI
jgi:hypothetical protein